MWLSIKCGRGRKCCRGGGISLLNGSPSQNWHLVPITVPLRLQMAVICLLSTAFSKDFNSTIRMNRTTNLILSLHWKTVLPGLKHTRSVRFFFFYTPIECTNPFRPHMRYSEGYFQISHCPIEQTLV